MADGSGNGYGYGGALSILSGTMRVIDTIIANNRATAVGKVAYGAALYNAGWTEVRNCLVRGNSGAYTNGGAIYSGGGGLQIIGSTLAYNGVVCIVRNAGTVAATNTILWGNVDDIWGTVSLVGCDVENGDSIGVNGCISAEPLFQYGFYLPGGSPCVDAGTNNAGDWGMASYTTHTSGSNDSGLVDIGYHYTNGISLAYANLYVATNGLDGNSGTNWAEAFRTVTKALSVAIDGTVIRVGAGQYTNILETFPMAIIGKNGLQILGAGRDVTVLDAKRSNRVVTLQNTSGHVVLEGLTVTGGKTNNGAGLLVDNCGDVTIAGCLISNNHAYATTSQGGGMLLTRSTVTVSNCVITVNSTTRIPNGSAYGGGIELETGVLLCRETIIASNAAGSLGYGGGLRVGTTARGVVRNCLVSSNNATSGHGIYSGGTLVCDNLTLVNNMGHGILCSAGGAAVTNGILWGNGDDVTGTVTLASSDIEDGDNNGTNGCISADPLFAGAATNNFRLLSLSPCRNTGVLMDWMPGGIDLGGNPRVVQGLPDMGAYEIDSALAPGAIFIFH